MTYANKINFSTNRQLIMPMLDDGMVVSSDDIRAALKSVKSLADLTATIHNTMKWLASALSNRGITLCKESKAGVYTRYWIHQDDIVAYRRLLVNCGLV